MLKIFNNLKPFFEDCYRRITVREYAHLLNISPPTASTLLSRYVIEGLLKKEHYKNCLFFSANKDSELFVDLSRIYWKFQLKPVVSFIEKELVSPAVVLFGSLAKAEVTPASDIDLAIFAQKRELSLNQFEKKLKRTIQPFIFSSFKNIHNEELARNIRNGYILCGRL